MMAMFGAVNHMASKSRSSYPILPSLFTSLSGSVVLFDPHFNIGHTVSKIQNINAHISA